MTRAVLVGIVAAALLPAQELTIIYWGRDSVYAWNASLASTWWLAQTEITAGATVVAGVQTNVGITPRGLRVDAAIGQWVRTGQGSRVGFRLAHTSTHHLKTAELYQVVAIPVLPQLLVGMAVYWATNSWYNPAWHVIRHGFSLTLLQ
jgi:hypothetical protein